MKASAFALLGASLLAATACDSSRNAVEDASTAAPTAENTASTEPVSFTRELTQGDARFEVRTTGSSAQRQLTIRSYRGSALTTDPVRVDINGAVRDAVTADLNGNGKPELYVFTDNPASNAGFYGYEFAERGYTPISSPGMIPGTAGVGYSGKDTYVLNNGTLSRTFPVTTTTAAADGTTPAAASNRTISYRLGADGKWTMGQVMDAQP
ncbi:hypothetical protein KBK19_18245 [Microvirga sp. STR05]|uniref:VCBS repeat-containing protein n=1 Tax=Hymenobacter duratus TaxID=2771356 RepID=A0ABR8JJE1_9BACT|nr:hypothetical protein [Hymenobacter duratus]MBD2716992.1 hypothetical protein [Hymenobacter duratus]MBR7951908.1 hypothetical protein [Microvirga sp. STR05]